MAGESFHSIRTTSFTATAWKAPSSIPCGANARIDWCRWRKGAEHGYRTSELRANRFATVARQRRPWMPVRVSVPGCLHSRVATSSFQRSKRQPVRDSACELGSDAVGRSDPANPPAESEGPYRDGPRPDHRWLRRIAVELGLCRHVLSLLNS